jgi:hypothetical protein
VTATRRRIHEHQAQPPQTGDPLAAVEGQDLRGVLDEELNRLPDQYRAPLVLCYLQGKTYTEAAKQLGWKDGTVCGRLARARELLRHRLVRRGLALSAAALAEPVAAPATSVAAVLRTAALFALGESAAGPSPTPAVTLAQDILHTMAVAKLKTVAAVVLAVCVFAAGAGWAAHQVLTPKLAETKREEEAKPAAKPDPIQQAKTDIYGDPLPPGVLVRMGTVRLRHEYASTAFSADGKTLISCGPDGWVRYWDVVTGKQVRGQQLGRTPEVTARFRFTDMAPGGAMVAARHKDVIYLYDTATGAERGRFDLGSAERGDLRFSPDGKRLAAGSTDAKGQAAILLWDMPEGKNRRVLPLKFSSWEFVFSPNGKQLITPAFGAAPQIWDTATGRELRNTTINSWVLAYAPNGKTLAAVNSDEKTIRLLDASSLAERASLKLSDGQKYNARRIAFSADGALLAAAGEQAVVVWDVAARKEKHRLADVRIDAMLFAPRGRTLACWGGGGRNSACGTPPRAAGCTTARDTPAGWWPWPFRPMARSRPRAACSTRCCACGRSPPASPCVSSRGTVT